MYGRISVGVIGAAPAEAALRLGFTEAERRGATLTVIAAGPAQASGDAPVRDLLRQGARRHPGVEVTFSVRRAVDAVVTLAAVSRSCDLMIVPQGGDAASVAAASVLTRRAHSPLVVISGSAGQGEAGTGTDELRLRRERHRDRRSRRRGVVRSAASPRQDRGPTVRSRLHPVA
ncbi:universal stress protein [Actinoplanes sp. NPDC024001]|uniref:universal stress protein n=1 Tax=Actinoplanes sp. NPDC024001 TaxID=3154598 RepID=UPI0033C2A47E